MNISNNPFIVSQVNSFTSFLSNTNQDEWTRKFLDVYTADNRENLIVLLKEYITDQTEKNGVHHGNSHTAKIVLNLIQMF